MSDRRKDDNNNNSQNNYGISTLFRRAFDKTTVR